ncbi:MAG TPA: CocE/NonD family hydrolase [Mycobacteriales bacterium]|nr:CocE/NonD family hydrolase [Mycobacteriales bacterium]
MVRSGRRRPVLGAALAGLVLAGGLAATSSTAATHGPKPFGLTCTDTEGVRYCPGDVSSRVLSFDGVPLDVNVVLPPGSRSRNLPLIVELHGWAGAKLGLDDDAGGFQDQRGGQYAFLPTPRELAKQGFAVLTYSSRGFGASCGTPDSRTTAACATGWTHLADARYEVHDTQWLAGLLADSGLVDPQRIGVLGSSYGGIQALELSTLGDRTVLPTGAYVAWTSPKRHLRMHLAAVAALDTASSLVDALVPNGRWRQDPGGRTASDIEPVGVPKLSWNLGLYGAGQVAGYIAPPGVDQSSDLTTSFLRLAVGDPEADPVALDALKEMDAWHAAEGLEPRGSVTPPTLLIYGWTDSLFPVDQALRWTSFENYAGALGTTGELLTDVGHPPAPNKTPDRHVAVSRVVAWMTHYLAGRPSVPVVHGVEAWLHTCTAKSSGPVRAASFDALHRSSAELRGPGGIVVGDAGDLVSGRATDPVAGDGICAAQQSPVAAGSVVDSWPVRRPLTLIGAPTVTTSMTVTDDTSQAPYVTGPAGGTQLDARLWDVAPDGSALLLTRLLYRPRAGQQAQTFMLHPIAYRVAAGHTIVLELRGSDVPYARPSNEPFAIDLGSLRLTLPTH